jgi:acetyl-CoA synthetase
MRPSVIEKRTSAASLPPNLVDYDAARASFSWELARRELDGLPGGKGLNIAHEAVDRHAAGAGRHHVALKWVSRSGAVVEYTYAQLAELTSRFANVLRRLGVRKGDHVFALAGRIPDVHIAALGTLKNGSVFCSLFSAYGPEPIRTRLLAGKARVLVTTERLYRRKVQQQRDALPDLTHVLVKGEDGRRTELPGTHDLDELLAAAGERFVIGPTSAEDPALLHFTSGTTGQPKAAVHVHAAVVGHHATGRLALDLRPGDVFWCTADPGWVTGISYGIVSPLSIGATVVIDEEEFDADRWYRILRDQRVTVWYTAPTAVRLLMQLGRTAWNDLSHLRFIASVGEPLSPAAVRWSARAFGRPLHDTWWQTETGAIMIANYACMDIRPGSMGRPVPGIDAAVVRRHQGGVRAVTTPGDEGELALRAGWPSMFRSYLGDEERYRECFADGWYLTGDLVRRDGDGYFWFVGRADDVIKSSGRLIGPFEVESVLSEHAAVADVAVVGRPDAVALEVVKAFVSLNRGYAPTETLRRALLAHARSRLGAALAPKELAFRSALPKTESGKIMRRALRAEEDGH